MQDFTKYDYTITAAQMDEAQQDGQTVIVIINGEYYDYKPTTTKGAKEHEVF